MYLNYGYSRPDVFSTGPIMQHAHGGEHQQLPYGSPTPVEQIEPGKPTEAQPNGATPDGMTPGSGESKKTPSSVRKPKGPTVASPVLGSTVEDESGPAIQALSATGGAADQAASTLKQPRRLEWTAAGDSSSDTSSKPASGGWHSPN
jgi:hypothetical protein